MATIILELPINETSPMRLCLARGTLCAGLELMKPEQLGQPTADGSITGMLA